MKLYLFGDLYYDLEKVQDDIKGIAAKIREDNAAAIVNLEGPITDGQSRGIRKRGIHLRQKGACIEMLQELNTAGVTLSNNHMMDYGSKGLLDTRTALKNNGILCCGAGKNLSEAIAPMILTNGNRRLAIFNFGWNVEETVYAGKNRAGCSPRETSLVLKTVSDFSQNNAETDIIITMHWGFEYNLYPQPYDINLAHRLCDIENVRAVIGHHPHCPQPVEIYKNKPIYYSLGNFYFAGHRKNYASRLYENDPADMGNYGLAVIIDTAGWTFDTAVLYYDKKADKSSFIQSDCLPAKMPKIDPCSSEYMSLAVKYATKGNPVLGENELKNRLIILKYNLNREFKRHLGGIMHRIGLK